MLKQLFNILIVAVSILGCGKDIKAQDIQLSYKINGKKFTISNNENYDVINKPMTFSPEFIGFSKNSINTILVDIFRGMLDGTTTINYHYYKTIIINQGDLILNDGIVTCLKSIEVKDLFENDKSRFLTTQFIVFDFCISDKKMYLLRSSNDCFIKKSIKINLPL